MNSPSSLMVVVATYNERQSLPILVAAIWELIDDAQILVVDDSSPDGTGTWVQQFAQTETRLELLSRPHKSGLGAATIAGLYQALESNAAWIATMDADLSHDPNDLAAMWSSIQQGDNGQVDLLIGSRYVRGGAIVNWSLSRRISSRLVNWYSRWILRLKPLDNTSALRIYRASQLASLDLDSIDCRGYAYLEQILLHLQRIGSRMAEYPISFRDRQSGSSKITFSELFRNLRDLVKLTFR